jgi:peptidoglycan lytic transglycosylase
VGVKCAGQSAECFCDADHERRSRQTRIVSETEARDRVTERTERAQRAATRWRSALGLALAALVALSGCANFGAPPAELGGFETYRVNGRTYVPLKKWQSYREIGVASWYGGRFHGRTTANGERFDSTGSLTAAHRTLPFNVCAAVEHLPTGRSVIVRINDRGPFKRGRVIDLSRAAADELGVLGEGLVRVRVSAVGVADADGRCRTA